MHSQSWNRWIEGSHNEPKKADLCWRLSWQSNKCWHWENWTREQKESGNGYPVGCLRFAQWLPHMRMPSAFRKCQVGVHSDNCNWKWKHSIEVREWFSSLSWTWDQPLQAPVETMMLDFLSLGSSGDCAAWHPSPKTSAMYLLWLCSPGCISCLANFSS